MPVPRILGWERALVTWADAQRGRPYVWGETDCAALVRAAWTRIFGVDPWPFVLRWRTARAALRVLAIGGGAEALLLRVGAERIPHAFAQTGDVLLFDDDDAPGHAVGFAIAVPPGRWLTSTPEQGVFLGQARTGICWRAPQVLAA